MNKVILDGHDLINKSGLTYAVCGGFAIDLFLNRKIRTHTDYDITIFDENRKDILRFMFNQGWNIYNHIWDGKGCDHLIPIKSADDEMAKTVFMVWAVKPDCTLMTIKPKEDESGIFEYKMLKRDIENCDFIEITFDKKEGNNFICNQEKNIVRTMSRAILYNNDIPYLAPEVILYHKSASIYLTWPKTIFDFYHTAHLLNDEGREWLIEALKVTFPEGHEWTERLQTRRY